MISVYNIHRSPAVWDDPDEFQPERFGPLDGPVPTEQNTDYRYIPFSGGPRLDESLGRASSLAYILSYAEQKQCHKSAFAHTVPITKLRYAITVQMLMTEG